MKNCKRLLALLLAVLLMASLCACGSVDNKDKDDKDDSSFSSTEDGGKKEEDTVGTKPTEPSATQIPDGMTVYKVTVQDENGAPVVGAFVQICKEACIPAPTDANGVATWTVAEDDYKVSFVIVPAGYTAEEAYYFEGDSTEMTIVLKAA